MRTGPGLPVAGLLVMALVRWQLLEEVRRGQKTSAEEEVRRRSQSKQSQEKGVVMTIQDLGSIGELVGGLAVIATLIYLAAQIRQNTAMITAQTVQASVDATQRVLLFRTENPELRALLRKARADEDMTADDFEALASYLHASFMNFQARVQHHDRGLFDASMNESYEYILQDYLETAFVRRWWTHARALYGARFRHHCEAIIAAHEAGDGTPMVDWASAMELQNKRADD